MICWKIRIFAYWTTPYEKDSYHYFRCDLLKNSYLCLLNNTVNSRHLLCVVVVICWKIRIFAYWTTPGMITEYFSTKLWFAEKFVSLLIEQHPRQPKGDKRGGCDLLKNSYLCLLNNTRFYVSDAHFKVVICWKIRIFAYWTTPKSWDEGWRASCDLLKNSYLCLLNNTEQRRKILGMDVVICWKIRIFAYWTTPAWW